MCEKTYEHSGIEYSDQRECSSAMKSLIWAIEKETRELKLKRDGINLIYCAHRNRGHKEHEIEIQEKRGKYSFILDGKNLHTANNLADCVRWAKCKCYIDLREKIGETRSATTKPVNVSTHKETQANAKEDNSYSKIFGNRDPIYGRHIVRY